MAQGKYVELSVAQRADVWHRWKAGESLHTIGRAFDRPHTPIHRLLAHHGGIVPALRRRGPLALTRAGNRDRRPVCLLRAAHEIHRGGEHRSRILRRNRAGQGQRCTGENHFATRPSACRTVRRAETTKRIRETEAEAVAFVVCNAIGLGTDTASQDYVGLYGGDAKLLTESLEYVQQTANRILTAIAPE